MKRLLFVFFFFVSGCATLSQKILEVNPGMSKEQVFQKLGKPDDKIQDNNHLVYAWWSNYTTCFVSFREDKVVSVDGCRTDYAAKAIADAAASKALADTMKQNEPITLGEAMEKSGAWSNPARQPTSYGNPSEPPKHYGTSPAALSTCGYKPVGIKHGCDYSCMNGKWVQVCN